MAHSLALAKSLVASLAAHRLSFLPSLRRGYAAASEAASLAWGGSTTSMVGKMDRMAAIKQDAGASSAWSPDPVTGYYRPENCAVEIDAAELRQMLLNHKVRPH